MVAAELLWHATFSEANLPALIATLAPETASELIFIPDGLNAGYVYRQGS